MKAITLILLFISSLGLKGQSIEQYSKVKIELINKDIMDLSKAGLEIDHGQYVPNRYLTNVFSQSEINIIEQLGFNYHIVVEDMTRHVINRAKGHHDHNHDHDLPVSIRGLGCDLILNDVEEIETPENYETGTLAGYYTLEEAYATLDLMHAKFPEIISERIEIPNAITHEGHPIYYVKVSDNVGQTEMEPEILYTALHHAREPGGLTQMIFYLWHLMENYGRTEEVDYLVNNTQMFFIPIINVDGYLYNQRTSPEGGGFWRKNRYVNMNGDTVGVDLNRNYGYEWGYDNQGSSPNEGSGTYRGPEAFSEPETQAVRDFCLTHDFKICLNYHTYGDLLIHPWGYNDGATEDDGLFKAMGEIMTEANDYFVGTGVETVGYIVNGDSDDWMYGETEEKNKIFSLTPEVGVGFWVDPNDIDEVNKTAQRQNLNAAHLLLNYVNVNEITPLQELANKNGFLNFQIQKVGLAEGNNQINVVSLTNGFSFTETSFSYDLDLMESVALQLQYEINDEVQNNDLLKFEIQIDNGLYVRKIPFTKLYKNDETQVVFETGDLLEDDFNVLGEWGMTGTDFYSAPSSITDSPNGQYANAVSSQIILKQNISLENAEEAYIKFWAKWDIENNYDYVQVLASFNGEDYEPICGRYTNLGTRDQDPGEPLFDGIQDFWVEEKMSLNDLLGAPSVTIKFEFTSDNFVTGDGFYFDDFTVEIVEKGTSSTVDDYIGKLSLSPNPVKDMLNIKVDPSVYNDNLRLAIYNSQGQKLLSTNLKDQDFNLIMDKFQEGMYFVKIFELNKIIYKSRIVKIDD